MNPELHGREAHRCLCVLVQVRNGQAEGSDRCQADAVPDAPFCAHCEGRHPGWGEEVGVLVRHVPLGGLPL